MTISARRMLGFMGALILLILAAPAPARSQAATGTPAPPAQSDAPPASQDSYELVRGMNEFGVWGGGAFNSPTAIGTAEERKFLTIGLRYGRVFATSRHVAFEYTADVVPVAVVFQPDFARAFNRSPDRSIYGAGVSPIGFKFNFNRRSRTQLFASLSGGLLYFRRPVPVDVPGATRLNYTFEFSGGAQIFTRPRRAVTIGYRFQHISNGGRSQINPGLDLNVFYAGFSFFN